MKPEFEEKQYEFGANFQLQLHCPEPLFTPGQVAEKALGFDSAGLLDVNSKLWTVMDLQSTAGVLLVPTMWKRARRQLHGLSWPSYNSSVILQYKRSHFLTGTRCTAYRHWRQSYYKFSVDRVQHTTLRHLEGTLGALAHVRYAAPVFHKFDELKHHQRGRETLEYSTFVKPSTIGTRHSAWTFLNPGGIGVANSELTEGSSDTWKDVLYPRLGRRRRTTLIEHIRSVATEINADDITTPEEVQELGLIGEVALDDTDPDSRLQCVADILTICNHLGRTGSSWWLHSEPEGAGNS